MAINKEIILDNQAKITYIIIGSFTVTPNEVIDIELHGFTSIDYYNKALLRTKLIKEQDVLVQELNQLSDINDEERIEKLSKDINNLAEEINKTNAYEDYLVGKLKIQIPYIKDFSIENMESEILKLKIFN